MQKIIAIVPVAPLRAEASHRTEMVSQLLLGETAEILEQGKDFTKIKTDLDCYEGWVQNPQVTALVDEIPFHLLGYADRECSILFNHFPMHIPVGTPVFATGQLGKYPVDYANASYKKDIPFSAERIEAVAFAYINTAYLWGGRTTYGIDCSGYVQSVYAFFGITLPRDAYQQALVGDTIDFLEQTRVGDLAYFDNADGKIIHVGILLTPETVIHSSGKVRVDKIDAQGIVNADTGLRTHHLRIIKRIA